MTADYDAVWKALAEPTRRQILKLLRDGPKQTTEIVVALPHLSRFGIMKHLSVLRAAGLVSVRKEGTLRFNSINAIPIRSVYEELVDDYQDLWARRLTSLKRELETNEPPSSEAESDQEDNETPGDKR